MYLISALVLDIIIAILFARWKQAKRNRGIKHEETPLRKVKNMITHMMMFVIPVLFMLCLKERIETGTYISGLIADLFVSATGYWIMATAGRIVERKKSAAMLYRIFYYIFEVIALLELIIIITYLFL